MAWCWPGDKPLSEPMMVSLLTHICVTRPQWVNITINLSMMCTRLLDALPDGTKPQCSAKALEKWGQIAHTIGKYGDIGNFSGVTYVILPFVTLKFVGTQAPTAKIIGDIPDFSVLNVPKTQPRHNPASHYIEPKLTYVIHLRAISLEKFNLSITKIYLKLPVLNYSQMTCSPGSRELNHLSIVLSGAWNEWTPVWLGGWPFYLIPHCMVGRFDKVVIKTSTPKQNDRHFMHFAGNIFKHTFFKILVFWFKFHRSSFKSALVQVMAWCRQATSHYLTQCQPTHMLPYGVTRP